MNLVAKFCPFCGTEQKQTAPIKKEEQPKENQENIAESIEKLDENEIIEIVTSNDNSKREPQIISDKTILDVEEPEIIVEEVGKNDNEDSKE